MTVCDNRSDSFSITTSAAGRRGEAVFVSPTQTLTIREKSGFTEEEKELGGGGNASTFIQVSSRVHVWMKGRDPHTSSRAPNSTRRHLTFPSEQGGYLEGESGTKMGGGHISQARAERLFWFEFSLWSLACNMRGVGACPGRHWRRRLPSLRHTPPPLETRVCRKPDTNQKMGSDLEAGP